MGIIDKHAELLQFEDVKKKLPKLDENFFDSHDILHYCLMSGFYKSNLFNIELKLFTLPFFQGNISFVEKLLVKVQDSVLAESEYSSTEELALKICEQAKDILYNSNILESLVGSMQRFISYKYNVSDSVHLLPENTHEYYFISYEFVNILKNNFEMFSNIFASELVNFSTRVLVEIENKEPIDALKKWTTSQTHIPFMRKENEMIEREKYHLNIDNLIARGVIVIPEEAYSRFTSEQYDLLDRLLDIQYTEKTEHSFE